MPIGRPSNGLQRRGLRSDRIFWRSKSGGGLAAVLRRELGAPRRPARVSTFRGESGEVLSVARPEPEASGIAKRIGSGQAHQGATEGAGAGVRHLRREFPHSRPAPDGPSQPCDGRASRGQSYGARDTGLLRVRRSGSDRTRRVMARSILEAPGTHGHHPSGALYISPQRD